MHRNACNPLHQSNTLQQVTGNNLAYFSTPRGLVFAPTGHLLSHHSPNIRTNGLLGTVLAGKIILVKISHVAANRSICFPNMA